MSKDPKSTYYDVGGIETIDIIKAKLTPEQYEGYLLGNLIKYVCRLNWKGDASRDSEKCYWNAKWISELPSMIESETDGVPEFLKVNGEEFVALEDVFPEMVSHEVRVSDGADSSAFDEPKKGVEKPKMGKVKPSGMYAPGIPREPDPQPVPGQPGFAETHNE